MPQSITLICQKETSLRSIKNKIESKWPCEFFEEKSTEYLNVYENMEKEVRVSFNDIKPENLILDDYKENEDLPELLKDNLENKVYFLVTFTDFNFASVIVLFLLKKFAEITRDVWVDNDYGAIFSLSDMLENYRNNPDWDWRKVN